MNTSAKPKISEPSSLPTLTSEPSPTLSNAAITAKLVRYMTPMITPAIAARMR